MLILPLHRRLAFDNFPFVTAALVLVNLFVFLLLQTGDQRATETAFNFYRHSSLPALEFPVYKDWLSTHTDSRQAKALDSIGEESSELVFQVLQSDAEFLEALHAARLIKPDHPGYSAWQEQRSEFDQLWEARFSDRHVMRFSQVEPDRMFSAMFLHAGLGHLLGNMLFLITLGLLVEGALGPWLFLALYLLGGLGAQVASLAWRWGEVGTALGASGAIAALMGAYCVLWGRRKVRFFWWFFVVFDYVKAPALVLLPFWLGWEILNLAFNSGAHVGFDAHAGGIVSGAALAYLVVRLGWQRLNFLDEDTRSDQLVQAKLDLAQAQAHLGRLELVPARALYEALDQISPAQLAVRIGLYRCARYAKNREEIHRAASRVFELPLVVSADLQQLKSIYDDYLKACDGQPRLPPLLQLSLAQRWLRLHADADAEAMLRDLIAKASDLPGLAATWWQLASRADPGANTQRSRLEFMVHHYPQSAEAEKARFLLREHALGRATT